MDLAGHSSASVFMPSSPWNSSRSQWRSIGKTVSHLRESRRVANNQASSPAFQVHGNLCSSGESSLILVQSAQAFFNRQDAWGAAYLLLDRTFKALRDAWTGVAIVPNVAPARKQKNQWARPSWKDFLTNRFNPKVSCSI